MSENEYRPWEEMGETELEFFKRRFLEESARAELLERAAEPTCPDCGSMRLSCLKGVETKVPYGDEGKVATAHETVYKCAVCGAECTGWEGEMERELAVASAMLADAREREQELLAENSRLAGRKQAAEELALFTCQLSDLIEPELIPAIGELRVAVDRWRKMLAEERQDG